MKRLIIIFLFILPGFIQSQIVFRKGYDSVYTVQITASTKTTILQTSDSGYIFIGTIHMNLNSGRDEVYLIKTNKYGDTLWTNIYGTINPDIAGSLIQTNDGGFAFAGYSEASNTNWLIRTNSNGDTLWTKKYVSSILTFVYSLKQTSDGGFILVGSSILNTNEDYSLIKTDASGNFQWAQRYGGNAMDRPYSVCEISDSGYLIYGLSQSFGNADQLYLVKTDLNGNYIWSKTYGGLGDDIPIIMQKINNNEFIALAYTNSFNGSFYDSYILKYDSTGNVLWSKVYHLGNLGIGRHVVATKDQGYLISGNNPNGAMAFKINSVGDTVWAKNIGLSDTYAIHATATNDKGFATLIEDLSGTSSFGLFMIKSDSLGNSCSQQYAPISSISHTTTSNTVATVSNTISFNVSPMPMKIRSGGHVTSICNPIGIPEINNSFNKPLIFPNPNNGSFKIQIENEIHDNHIFLYNSLGQKVHEQKLIQGENSIRTINLSKGLYSYTLLQNKQVISNGKIVVE